MSIIRTEKKKYYVVMDRTALNDARLSWKAKGLLAYMLSMPDDWTFHIDELVTHALDGKDSLRSGLNELKKYGYVERRAVRDGQTKKIKAWETIVHEKPEGTSPVIEEQQLEKLEVAYPQMEEPYVENPPLLSTNNHQVLNTQSTEQTKACEQPSAFDQHIAQQLVTILKKRIPTFRTPNINSWAKHIYDLRVNDGVCEQQIEQLLQWATTHAFWQAHIVSTKILRDKATTLLLQMNAQQATEKPLPSWFLTRHEKHVDVLSAHEEAELERRRQRLLKKLER